MKCPICSEEVVGDPIAHIKTQSHELALAKLLQSEQASRPTSRAADAKACEPIFHQLMKLQGKLFCCDCGVRL